MKITLEILGEKIVERDMLRITDRANDLRPVFEVLANDFYRIETEQFDSEGAYASGGWKPLTAAYLKDKVRRGYDHRILHRTKAMRNSLTRMGARGSVRRIRAETMELGTSITNKKGFPYPKVHQTPRRGQARRRPVEFREADKRSWVKAVQRFVVTGDVGAVRV